MWITPAYAQEAAAAAPNALIQFLPLIGLAAIFYFLIIRPQQQRVKKHQEMVAALRRGDAVVTQGGIVGKVTKLIDDAEVQVEIADGVSVKILRQAITDVRNRTEPANDAEKPS